MDEFSLLNKQNVNINSMVEACPIGDCKIESTKTLLIRETCLKLILDTIQ